jgi:imidazoleglycerol-phosphate dehydratase
MKIAFVLFDGFSSFDFASLYQPLTLLRTLGLSPELSWDLCARQKTVTDAAGLPYQASSVGKPLDGYDLVLIPGVRDASALVGDEKTLNWLLSAGSTAWLGAVGSGALLLAAAGLLKGKRAAADESTRAALAGFGAEPAQEEVVEQDGIFTAANSAVVLRLGLLLCAQLNGLAAAQQVQSALGVKAASAAQPLVAEVEAEPLLSAGGSRFARVVRKTGETDIEIELDLDGSGRHVISTGLPFLDHMLTQIAVHGLFDLNIKAVGDLQVDAHHTVEDVALALGEAFARALGDRKGIVRMASAYCPMDETLAYTVIDFSGRPYAVVQAPWEALQIGGIPTSLFTHFLESFAFQAKCNLHAQVLYGRDDHHKAEALFKSLARALDAAVRIDERRAGDIPSSKGVLA